MFLQDGPRLLAEVRSAIDSGDGATLRAVGHTLRGTAGSLAGAEIQSVAARLESAGKSGTIEDRTCYEDLVAAFDRFHEAVGDLAPVEIS